MYVCMYVCRYVGIDVHSCPFHSEDALGIRRVATQTGLIKMFIYKEDHPLECYSCFALPHLACIDCRHACKQIPSTQKDSCKVCRQK